MSELRNGSRRGDPSPKITAALAELSMVMLGTEPLTVVLRRVATVAARVVPGADEVSVTLIDDGAKPRTVGFSGSRAPILDERQYETGFGPCLDAAITGTTVSIEDTATDETYRAFSALAHRHGIRRAFAVGLPIPQQTIGALNFYGGGDHPFDAQGRTLATMLAGHAAVFVANAAAYDSSLARAAQMEQAMASRAVIEQAKGIVMGEKGCTPDEAFRILAKLSSTTNVKLRDIAIALVEGAQRRR
jgi:GAF domain-containing protein